MDDATLIARLREMKVELDCERVADVRHLTIQGREDRCAWLIPHLHRFAKLERLAATDTHLGDDGFRQLTGMRDLQVLWAGGAASRMQHSRRSAT